MKRLNQEKTVAVIRRKLAEAALIGAELIEGYRFDNGRLYRI